MRIPASSDVLAASHLAKTRPLEALVGVDPVRMAKASVGLINLATPALAAYFERNVVDPFPQAGWTSPVPLATIPTFAFTALTKELKASQHDVSHHNNARLHALTKGLRQHLEARGYDAQFEIRPRDGANDQLLAWLKPKSE